MVHGKKYHPDGTKKDVFFRKILPVEIPEGTKRKEIFYCTDCMQGTPHRRFKIKNLKSKKYGRWLQCRICNMKRMRLVNE